MQIRVALPLEHVRHLGIGDEPQDSDLLPDEFAAIRELPVAVHRGAAEAFFEGGEVVHLDAPAHPAATAGGPGTDGLAERSLVRRRVVEDLHDLQVLVSRERNDHVAGAEARMDSALHCFDPEGSRDTFGGGSQAIVFTGVRDVIHAHGNIFTLCDEALSLGLPYWNPAASGPFFPGPSNVIGAVPNRPEGGRKPGANRSETGRNPRRKAQAGKLRKSINVTIFPILLLHFVNSFKVMSASTSPGL